MTKGRDPGQVIRPGRSEQSDPTNLLGWEPGGFSPPQAPPLPWVLSSAKSMQQKAEMRASSCGCQ